MNCLENFYIQMHQQQGKLIKEQNFGLLNSLLGIMYYIHLQHACEAHICKIRGLFRTTSSVHCVHFRVHTVLTTGVYTT